MIKRIAQRARALKSATMLRTSAILTIFALMAMVWSIVDPTPVPVMLAMSLGQVLGTVAFALYGIVILRELRADRRDQRASAKVAAPTVPGDPL
ncbi:MAG: hypothetical protein WKG01_28215 [Kofleriaceae bacterium]